MDILSIKKLKNSDNAVVGIITAILLIGLLISVITIIQTVFVPNWMEQIESEHMDQVADQFAQLKFSIDLQSVLQERNLPVASPITLGNRRIPLFSSIRSYGDLEIIQDECTVTIQNQTTSYNYPVGIIKYSSSNSYFIDQSFIYETGALIISQDEGNIISITPLISVENLTNDYNITLSIINISVIGNKDSISGYGTYPIRIEYFNSSTINITNLDRITISTEYPESWGNHLNYVFRDDDVQIGEFSSYTYADFSGMTKNANVLLRVVDIYAQIAPGWIE
jgi:hypothetical protein